MKKSFGRLSGQDTAEERISEWEDTLIEASRTEKQEKVIQQPKFCTL
jgi:hypothetical protein